MSNGFRFEDYENIEPKQSKGFNFSQYENITPNEEENPLQDAFREFVRNASKNYLSKVFGATGKATQIPMAETIGEKAGLGAAPFVEQLPRGLLEGFSKAKAGITGQEFIPSPIPEEYGAGLGRGFGQELTRGALVAPLIAGATIAGGPLAGIGATGLAYGVTEPGNLLDRLISGGEAAALPAAGMGLKYLFKTAKTIPAAYKSWRSLKGLESELSDIDPKLSEAVFKLHLDTQDYQALKHWLETQKDIGNKSPNAILRQANKLADKTLAKKYELASIPKEFHITEEPSMPHEIEPQEIPTEAIKNAETQLATKQAERKALEEAHSKLLGKGTYHDVPIAKAITEHFEGVKNPTTGKYEGGRKKEIGAIFNKAEDKFKNDHISFQRPPQLSETEKNIRALFDKSKHLVGTALKGDEELEASVSKMMKQLGEEKAKPTYDLVPADEVLSNYRTLQNTANKLRQKAFEPGKAAANKDLQKELLEAADTAEMQANNLEKILEEHGHGEGLELLNTAKGRWKNEIVPLYKNKIYRSFLYGQGPENIMKALRGEGSGQELIRNVIKSDPELVRNIIGQRYAKNPALLHEYDQLTEEYLKHHPESQKFIKEHALAKEAEHETEQHLARTKEEHEVASKEEIKKAKEKNIQNKLTYAQQKKYHQLNTDIQKNEETITFLRNKADELEKRLAQKDLSLKNKLQLEKQKSELKSKIAQAKKDKITLTKSITALIATTAGAYRYGKKAKELIE